jgi:hypothetical protein
MRTKTLLLTAALSAAGLATSMAQVYSVNAVGYVNVTVPANGYAILGNPLNGTNNALNTILYLPNGYDGANIFRFDPPTQSYLDPIAWIEGLGWLSASDPNPTINPGEGFFIQNVAGVALNITFVGEVPAGAALNNPVVGNNRYSLRSSVVPKGLKLGDTGIPNTLEFPADDGDNVFVFDAPTQQYKDTYSYIEGLGWISASDADPDGPVIAPGTGFFSQKTAPDRVWTQSFSVN